MSRASRADRGDFIELVQPDRPSDRRFDLSGIGPVDGVGWEAIGEFEVAGFDTNAVLSARAAETLISWEWAHLSQRGSSPIVGRAAVIRADPNTARLIFCDITPNVPVTALLDLCLQVAHVASWHGVRQV